MLSLQDESKERSLHGGCEQSVMHGKILKEYPTRQRLYLIVTSMNSFATSSPSRNVICRCEHIWTLKGATCSFVLGESISIFEQFGCCSLSQLCQAGVSTDAVIVKSVTVEESSTPFCFIRLNQQSIFLCRKNWIEGLVDKFALIVMMRE